MDRRSSASIIVSIKGRVLGVLGALLCFVLMVTPVSVGAIDVTGGHDIALFFELSPIERDEEVEDAEDVKEGLEERALAYLSAILHEALAADVSAIGLSPSDEATGERCLLPSERTPDAARLRGASLIVWYDNTEGCRNDASVFIEKIHTEDGRLYHVWLSSLALVTLDGTNAVIQQDIDDKTMFTARPFHPPLRRTGQPADVRLFKPSGDTLLVTAMYPAAHSQSEDELHVYVHDTRRGFERVWVQAADASLGFSAFQYIAEKSLSLGIYEWSEQEPSLVAWSLDSLSDLSKRAMAPVAHHQFVWDDARGTFVEGEIIPVHNAFSVVDLLLNDIGASNLEAALVYIHPQSPLTDDLTIDSELFGVLWMLAKSRLVLDPTDDLYGGPLHVTLQSCGDLDEMSLRCEDGMQVVFYVLQADDTPVLITEIQLIQRKEEVTP